ncbi:hypothetical protein Enr13x_24110 [Stieleria neptunia]|uniref:General secretion pathway protein K n=1 Tax=Stieleria neptunia TaxID=2527979 RepID=A0A518HNZ4_9BACT|nr:hypothetical protein Enr13x_24110 [Stieleria neptunia]
MENRGRTIRSQRRGYILLTVVVILAVAVLMLSRIASTSMRSASYAVENERSVRHQWAITSLRRMALNAAPSLLTQSSLAENESSLGHSPILWKEVGLAGETWRVVLADESAKLNVSKLSATAPTEQVAACLRQLQTSRGLQSQSNFDKTATRWDHWFELPAAGSGNRDTPAILIAAATQRLTLWGDGKLNVCRCDSESLDYLWHMLYSRPTPKQLQEIRHMRPTPTESHLIGSLALRESEARLAAKWLTTESQCYSVWIFCMSDRRVPASFFVEWGRGQVRDRRGYEY